MSILVKHFKKRILLVLLERNCVMLIELIQLNNGPRASSTPHQETFHYTSVFQNPQNVLECKPPYKQNVLLAKCQLLNMQHVQVDYIECVFAMLIYPIICEPYWFLIVICYLNGLLGMMVRIPQVYETVIGKIMKISKPFRVPIISLDKIHRLKQPFFLSSPCFSWIPGAQ